MNAEPRWPELRTELINRAKHDQDARSALDDPPTSEQWEAVKAVDADNTPWLEGIVAEHGWPGAELVCEEGTHAAWLLAQHAPLYLPQQWLPLLRQAAEAGDAAAVDLAYLDDRVRIREQRPQRHGTQWLIHGGEQRLMPIEDAAGINERRAILGLPRLSEDDIANVWSGDAVLNTPDTPT